MQARIVEAAAGARWLAEGWRLFRAAPLQWIALTFAYMLLMVLMSVVPLIGTAGFLVIYPALTVGLMVAARAASKSMPIEIGMLFDGLRRGGARVQLVLGAIYLACSILVFAGIAAADTEQKLRTLIVDDGRQELHIGDLLAPLVALVALYTPMLAMFWFAPPLAAWHGVGAAKSLFFSLVACLMNWRAFVVYGAVTLGAIIAAAGALRLILALAPGDAAKGVPLPALLLIVVLLLPTFFASFYASYRDVFGAEAKAP
jgi:hypothetical protein